MELIEYQKRAMTTCMDSSRNFSYMVLNLVGEVGELASKVAKSIRKGHRSIEESRLIAHINKDFDIGDAMIEEQEMKKEIGDTLWQVAGLCSVMGWSLEDIAKMNLDKLASRQKRDVIDGNGDNR